MPSLVLEAFGSIIPLVPPSSAQVDIIIIIPLSLLPTGHLRLRKIIHLPKVVT